MTGRNMAFRIAKLENAKYAKPRRQYVYHVSDPPTVDEQEAIDSAIGPIISRRIFARLLRNGWPSTLLRRRCNDRTHARVARCQA
jgi:hypothetical protein